MGILLLGAGWFCCGIIVGAAVGFRMALSRCRAMLQAHKKEMEGKAEEISSDIARLVRAKLEGGDRFETQRQAATWN